MNESFVSVDIDFIFQLINTIFLIGILFLIFYFIFRLPKKIKSMSQRMSAIEEDLKNIKDKLN
ncbi:hypothetical protein [Tepidibacter aestuarii]|uniref:hypothetical protein n=1 Tax=Tepidibacter aestuarii TaxID=2925782 RepID=UPI0020BF3073|nr:hypothetical protein [Tepidibacter aestuarii]CAH2213055.1 conserved protein of unknown function [Tepidibacter aestuarii]